ncbi:type VI secretion system contractile sheath domain-containing protein [Colwellia sp. E150_009]|jgi:type VI secretion system ImpB/VipA family protein
MSGGLNFEYGFNTNISQPKDNNMPMRIYFLGDFTGARSAKENTTTHSIVAINIDNFDEVMIKLSPSLELPSGEELAFHELEDFHPDNLFEHAIFNNLRRLKQELSNPSTAERATQEILSSYQLKESFQTQNNTFENKNDMFERLLGQQHSSPGTSTPQVTANSKSNAADKLNQFLTTLLKPHIIKDIKPEHENILIFINTAIEELMRSIMHSSEFQALESAWRSTRDVIFNTNYDESCQLFYLVNTSKKELHNAVSGNNSFVTKISQHIQNIDSTYYDVLIGNYQFSDTNDDINTLNYLASLAETLQCQFIGAATDSLINAGADSLWHQFRQTPQAKCTALSYPRILLRLPYGKKQDEINTFVFEEFRQSYQHEQLLWGNSAFVCAQILINQYHSDENIYLKTETHITDLPAFIYIEDNEKKLHPCSEFLLSEQQLIHINKQGIMVFASYRNKNSIRLFSDEIHAVNT